MKIDAMSQKTPKASAFSHKLKHRDSVKVYYKNIKIILGFIQEVRIFK